MKLLKPKIIKFECVASLTENEDKSKELKECKASLSELGKILDGEINVDDKSLKYFVGDLAIAGSPNKNDDGISIIDAVKVHKLFEKKPINLEHTRRDTVGYIVKSVLTDFEHNVLTDEQALASESPVNISIGFIVWSHVDPDLSEVLEVVGRQDSDTHGLISLSWEMSFDEYNILLGDSIFGGEFLTEDAEIEKYDKYLKANEGDGKFIKGSENSVRVTRFVTGSTLMPLGGGLVVKPAAAVKGISIVANENNNLLKEKEELTNKLKEIDENFSISVAKLAESLEKMGISAQETTITFDNLIAAIEEKSSQDLKATVRKNRLPYMKIKNLEDIKDESLVAGEIKACELVDFISEKISKESETFSSTLAAEKLAKEEADKKFTELTSAHEEIKNELKLLQEAKAAAEIENNFANRMTSLNEEFVLANDELAVITPQIRGLDDDSFSSWKASFDVLAKEKKKDYIQMKKEEAEKAKGEKTEEEKTKEAKAAEDKAQEEIDKIKSKETQASTIDFSTDAIEKYKNAFSVGKGVKISRK